MGASQTKKVYYGEWTIATREINFAPGETIDGQVFCKLEQSIPTNQILLELSVLEQVYFENFEVKNEENRDTHLQTYKIVSIKNGILPAGSHVFPFSVKLPVNLQSSFDYKNSSNSKSYFKIEYNLNAYVMDNSATLIKMSPIVALQKILISRPSAIMR